MTDNGDILLLGDESVEAELSRLGAADLVGCRQPYQALEALAGGTYATFIVAQPCPELPALVRAARRLRQSMRIYALCSPASEAELRPLAGRELDDYFIFPPSRRELERMCGREARLAPRPGRAAATGPGGAAGVAELSPCEIASLIESADSIEDLARCVRAQVQAWVETPVEWSEPGAAAGEPLLLMDLDLPRVLAAADGFEPDPATRARLQALQVLLGPLANQARRTQALHKLAVTDHLTGAYNRRYFYHFTDKTIERAKAERLRVTLLLYDIDNFKRYNDTYGHAAGDEILRETARLMRQVTRTHDVVARIGGDEFAVLFWDAEPPRKPDSQQGPGAPIPIYRDWGPRPTATRRGWGPHPSTACILADRFIRVVREHEFHSLGPEAKGVLTISGGLATYPWDGGTCRELLRHADGALRAAKQSGKNCIYLVGSEGSQAQPAGPGPGTP